MARTDFILQRFAAWSSRVTFAQLPERIVTAAQAQLLSMAAAGVAGRSADAGNAVARAWRRLERGRRVSLPGGGRAGILAAVDQAASWSLAHDYDDYTLMGHCGHSAVWVPLLLGDAVKCTHAQFVTAAVVANEAAARLGTSLVLGPHNGQMWAPIHRLAGAAAAAKLLDLDAARTAHALAIALYDANDPVFDGFFGVESKVRTAPAAATAGVLSAYLAAEGLTGAVDLLEADHGFWHRFTYAPLPATFDGLGHSWCLDTLTIKPVPGCAYVTAVALGAERTCAAARETLGRLPRTDEIAEVVVEAGLLTVGMEALWARRRPRDWTRPAAINFSVPLTAGLTCLHGALDSRAFAPDALEKHGEALTALAARVRLVHDPALTQQTLAGLEQAFPLQAWLEALPLTTLWRVRRRFPQDYGGSPRPDVWQAVRRGRPIDAATWRWLRRASGTLLGKTLDPLRGFPPTPLPFARTDLRQLRFRFPARVTLRLRNGQEWTAAADTAEGHRDGAARFALARAKWRREAINAGVTERGDQLIAAMAERADAAAMLAAMRTV